MPKCVLWYAFPFEGNWNHNKLLLCELRLWTCDTLSRLKGIETSGFDIGYGFSTILVIRFPVWREWKHCRPITHSNDGSLWYAFPFEGNWNSRISNSRVSMSKLVIRFPVWRELKLIRGATRGAVRGGLVIRFPVWRELKPSASPSMFHAPRAVVLWYAFPFEGNWN